MLWIALGLKLGVEPVRWSHFGGMISFLGAVYGTWRLASLIFRESLAALLAVLLLIANYTFLAYATGGLETMLQAALVCLAMLQLHRIARRKAGIARPFLLSSLLAAAVLTRMDSALPAAIIGIAALVFLYREPANWKSYLALALPFAVLVGSWFIWKATYYGRILPNSYYAKVSGGAGLANGLVYLWRFFHWYLLWPFLLLGALVLLVRRRETNRRLMLLLIVILVWCGYVIWVGGDFMEFRFLVPIAPFLFVLLAYLVYYQIGRVLIRRPAAVSLVTLGALLAVSVFHARSFVGVTADRTLDSISSLADFYGVYPDHDWRKIGETMKSAFKGVPAVLATSAVGAIPYYSDLRTVDMLGLNDRYVAEHGVRSDASYRRPGHLRHAPLSYLQQQKVNFVIGHPSLVSPGFLENPDISSLLSDWIQTRDVGPDRVTEMTAVILPLDARQGLLLWYFTPTEEIDSLIRARHWEARTVSVR